MNSKTMEDRQFQLCHNGAFVFPRLKTDLQALISELEQLEQEEIASGEAIVMESSTRTRYVMRSRLLQEAIHKSGIYACANELLGGKAILGSAQLNNVGPSKPGSEGLKWHVDYPYFAMQNPKLLSTHKNLLAVQVIIALDRFTKKNGATIYRPVLGGEARQVLLQAGQSLIMAGNTLHAVPRNETSQNRRAVLLVFHPYWVRPLSTRTGSLYNILGVTPHDVIPELHPMFDNSTPLFQDLKGFQ